MYNIVKLVNNKIMQTSQPLSNLQLELLKVFSRPVSNDDLLEIKQLLSDYFARKAAKLADDSWDENGFTEKTMTDWRKRHLRTEYKVDKSDNTPT
ncbi:hypothetical protein GCM10028825_34530 [Spirosoma agri]